MTTAVSWDPFDCVACEVQDRDVAPAGPLAGREYVAKDLFDVGGLPTAAGNPDFAKWRGPALEDAWAIDCLRKAGARLVAKAHLHELALGITGVNPHFGTPTNPRAPGRLPGGSSSGSAVAVAGGLVPFALGTDTGGSVREPASFCGIYGYRPTYGWIPTDGVVPLAPSFDTVGVLAASAALLRSVAEVLMRPPRRAYPGAIEEVMVPDDALERSSAEARDAAQAVARGLAAAGLRKVGGRLGLLDDAREAQRTLQGAEAWAVHERWITSSHPRLGADVSGLLERGSKVGAAELGRASAERARISLQMERITSGGRLVAMPASTGPAPTLEEVDTGASALEVRTRLLSLTNLASVAGLPVVVVPGTPAGALPIGVQLVGPRGSDAALLALAARLEAAPR